MRLMTGAGFCGSLTSAESPDIDWQPIEKGRHSDPFLFDLYLYFTSLSVTQLPFGAKCKWFIQTVLNDFFAGEGLTTFDTRPTEACRSDPRTACWHQGFWLRTTTLDRSA